MVLAVGAIEVGTEIRLVLDRSIDLLDQIEIRVDSTRPDDFVAPSFPGDNWIVACPLIYDPPAVAVWLQTWSEVHTFVEHGFFYLKVTAKLDFHTYGVVTVQT